MASLESFSSLLKQTGSKGVVVFWQPRESRLDDGNQWRETSSIQFAKGLNNVDVVFDPMGVEFNRFRASVSGHCVVFSPKGHPLYSGGITSARGHSGPSTALGNVVSAIQRSTPARSAPVFGCPIQQRSCSSKTQ